MLVLDDPHCPNCQSVVSLGKLYWKGGTNRAGFFTHNTGIVCPTCGAKLPLLQLPFILAYLLGLILFFWVYSLVIMHFLLREISTAGWSGWAWALLVLVPAFVAVAMIQRYTRRFARLRPVEEGEQVAFPLSKGAR
jgi:hypothetical protein